jgi:hypothetical protein
MSAATPFVKHDADKPRMDLLPPEALVAVAQVLTLGARKYSDHNWRKATNWGRYSAAAMRHIVAWQGGEDFDPETGMSHLSHATACLMFLIALQETEVGTDDRYKPGATSP